VTQGHERKHDEATGASSPGEDSKAWLDELVRTGKVVDVTEEAMRHGLGAIIITGIPAPRSREQESGDAPLTNPRADRK
jgi:hypothetical protein